MSDFNTVDFHDKDLPNMASHCPQEECGYTIYRGVLVQWDEDHDDGVLLFIDQLPETTRSRLLVVQEHEARLGLVWKDEIPDGFRVQDDIDVGGDSWTVEKTGVPGNIETWDTLFEASQEAKGT